LIQYSHRIKPRGNTSSQAEVMDSVNNLLKRDNLLRYNLQKELMSIFNSDLILPSEDETITRRSNSPSIRDFE
jgi:hypothetical protein